MIWTARSLGGFQARDKNHNSWAVRPSIGNEQGPWRVYVNGAFKGRADNESTGMSRADQLADAIAAAPPAQRHALLYAR